MDLIDFGDPVDMISSESLGTPHLPTP